MTKPTLLVLALVATAISIAASAQKTPSASTVITSVPGKAMAVTTTELAATVVAIDKATRTVTLKGAEGRTLEVECGDEVRNFDQLRIGDQVTARYHESLTLELKKTRAPTGAAGVSISSRAAPGARPGAVLGHEVQVLADVVAVNPAKHTISLKGPQGNIVDLNVRNPDHFKVVKVGDQVEAVYTQALAIAVTPAAKPAGPAAPAKK